MLFEGCALTDPDAGVKQQESYRTILAPAACNDCAQETLLLLFRQRAWRLLWQVFTSNLDAAGFSAEELKEVIDGRQVSIHSRRTRSQILLEISLVFAKDMRAFALGLNKHANVFTRGAQEAQEVIYS